MQVSITGKQIDVSDAFRSQVEGRLATVVDKYFGNAIEAHVTLSRDGNRFRVDCAVHVGHGIHLNSHGAGIDAYGAFEGAAARLEKQLRRYKRRLRDHHSKQKHARENAVPAQSYVLAAAMENPALDGEDAANAAPAIIAETETTLPTCSVVEAVMRMDLADAAVLMFQNSAHGRMNVIYRRPDGNIGWIDPKQIPG